MSDLVDKVARAIWDATEDESLSNFPTGSTIIRSEARAAIAAVLDDLDMMTPAMRDAGTLNMYACKFDAGENCVDGRHVWRGILEAKRKEIGLSSPQKPQDAP